MLSEGRLSGDDQLQAYAQIERAASRISTISRQASDLSRWLSPITETASPLLCSALMADAIIRSGPSPRVIVSEALESSALWISALDRHALAAAMAAAIESVLRETPDEPICLNAREDRTTQSCDILIGTSAAIESALGAHAPDVTSWSADRGGMGLALVLCGAVVNAHGGQLHMLEGRRDFLSVRLPMRAEAA